MGEDLSPAVWGLIGTVVGALASVGTTWISNAHAARLETEKAKDTRAEIARAFQRQTVIELQNLVQEEAHQAAAWFLKCEAAYREGGSWGDGSFWGASSLRSKIAALNHRVADDALREQMWGLLEAVDACLHAEDEKSATAHIKQVEVRFFAVSNALGAFLRSQYEPA